MRLSLFLFLQLINKLASVNALALLAPIRETLYRIRRMVLRLLLAVLLMLSTQFGTQMVLPALPQIAEYFALSQADTQQIIMLYFISFGLSQLVYGPWADGAGLRRVFIVGQAFFLLGSMMCYLANSVEVLALGRILQGLGAGAPLILSRVILSKSLSGEKLQKAFGSMAIFASVGAVFSPFAGGLLTSLVNWQFLFFTFSLYMLVVTTIGLYLLPIETKPISTLKLKGIAYDYLIILKDLRFFNAAAFKWWPTMMFMSAGTFLPFELQSRFDLSPEQYGSLMMVPMLGLIVGSISARLLQKRFTAIQVIALFWPLMVICGLMLTIWPTDLTLVIIAYSCFMIACGAYYPSALQLAIEPFTTKAGSASAMLGSIDMLLFSILAALANRFWVDSLSSLGSLYLLCCIIIGLSCLGLWRRHSTVERVECVEA